MFQWIYLISVYAVTFSFILIPFLYLWPYIRSSRFQPKGKHCYITGGSSGLGKAIAKDLVRLGANVTIIARREEELVKAIEDLKSLKVSPDQKLIYISADVTDPLASEKSFYEAESIIGQIDYIFNCAGASKPGYFIDQSLEDFEKGMKLNYFGTLYTTKIATNYFIKKGIKGGKIIMVSSTLGLMSLIGYSQYAPSKHALRSLADTLRQELLPYDIDIHIYFVSTIHSPGYNEEQKTKPKITKLIEGAETSDASPEARSKALLNGLKLNQFAITSDFVTDLFRLQSIGITPKNNLVTDFVLGFVASIIVPLIRIFSDFAILKNHETCKKSKLDL